MAKLVTEEQYIYRVTAQAGSDYAFKGWHGDYNGSLSAASLACCNCNHEWTARINNLFKGRGCPECAKRKIGESTRRRILAGEHKPKARKTGDEYIAEITAVAAGRYEVLGWNGEFKGATSRALCRCSCGHEWSAIIGNLLNGRACSVCANHGFNQQRTGFLYALRSHCGTMVKVGISNDPKRRLRELKARTPFGWECIELLKGHGADIARFEKEIHTMTERATLQDTFDGATEWRLWDDRLPGWYKERQQPAS